MPAEAHTPHPLTPKQQRFVAEYLIDCNATQAAIRAGYSAHTANEQGSRLLANARVRAAVDAGSQAVIEKAAGSAEWIVAQAVAIVNRSMNAGDLKAAVPALALLARRHPEFSEKHDVTLNARTQVLAIVASMSNEELRAAKGRLGSGHADA